MFVLFFLRNEKNYLRIILKNPPFMEFCIPGPKVIKLFSCSAQFSMKFFLLIKVKMPTAVGILTSMSKKTSIFGFSESEKS